MPMRGTKKVKKQSSDDRKGAVHYMIRGNECSPLSESHDSEEESELAGKTRSVNEYVTIRREERLGESLITSFRYSNNRCITKSSVMLTKSKFITVVEGRFYSCLKSKLKMKLLSKLKQELCCGGSMSDTKFILQGDQAKQVETILIRECFVLRSQIRIVF